MNFSRKTLPLKRLNVDKLEKLSSQVVNAPLAFQELMHYTDNIIFLLTGTTCHDATSRCIFDAVL